MKNLMVLLFMAVTVTACAQTESETTKDGKKVAESAVTRPETTTVNEPECKVCDFDFESYKGDLRKTEIEGLLLALNDEYLATSIYKGVNEKFDDPRPFVNIDRAEMKHAEMLGKLFTKFNIPVPDNKWIGQAPSYESVIDACKAGVEAEIANMQLYDELFKSTDREEILEVYKSLKKASEENHKPAFERCAAQNGKGSGRGQRNS